MTTLNTIIEEEKKEFDVLYGWVKPLTLRLGMWSFTTTAMQRAVKAERVNWLRSEIEKLEILHALAQMYIQYCGDKSGHVFMTAGEEAQEVLERFGILKGANEMGGEGEIDWEALTSIITRYKEELKVLTGE